ncbi:MAG: hypothetical protein HC846_10335 [Blastocatellia bacterium]|nr:hypothetical protein [Blastocatellia bacterium]
MYYPIEYKGDIARNSKSYFWKNAVEPLFNVPNPQEFREIGGLVEFLEGAGVERSTGKSVYVGLNIVSKNGWGRAIVGVAPNKQAFQTQFPHPDNLAASESINRFAVTAKDLVGEWSGNGGSMVEIYNIYSGNYAGTMGAAMSDRFTFGANNSYQSAHKGASGNVGAMNLYSQKHNGTFKVSDWEVTLTSRFNGETSVYSAYFEAVRGGKVLHLMNKKFSGEKYALVKAK